MCKGSRVWDPGKDFSQRVRPPTTRSTFSAISFRQERTGAFEAPPRTCAARLLVPREYRRGRDPSRLSFDNVTTQLVPGRSPSLFDALASTSGAVFGLAIVASSVPALPAFPSPRRSSTSRECRGCRPAGSKRSEPINRLGRPVSSRHGGRHQIGILGRLASEFARRGDGVVEFCLRKGPKPRLAREVDEGNRKI